MVLKNFDRYLMLVLLLSVIALTPAYGKSKFFKQSETFTSTSEDAILVVKSTFDNTLDPTAFKRFDIEKVSFEGRHIVLGGDSEQLAASFDSRSGKPLDQTGYFVRRLPAGDYALVYTEISGSTPKWYQCYAKGTAIYRLEPGKIHVIERANQLILSLLKAEVLKERAAQRPKLSTLLELYPGISAEIVQPEIIAMVEFESEKSGLSRKIKCPKNRTARIISDHASTEAFGP